MERKSSHANYERPGSVLNQLSPLLGRFTAEEFHMRMIRRICPSCELESLDTEPQAVLNYNWKDR